MARVYKLVFCKDHPHHRYYFKTISKGTHSLLPKVIEIEGMKYYQSPTFTNLLRKIILRESMRYWGWDEFTSPSYQTIYCAYSMINVLQFELRFLAKQSVCRGPYCCGVEMQSHVEFYVRLTARSSLVLDGRNPQFSKFPLNGSIADLRKTDEIDVHLRFPSDNFHGDSGSDSYCISQDLPPGESWSRSSQKKWLKLPKFSIGHVIMAARRRSIRCGVWKPIMNFFVFVNEIWRHPWLSLGFQGHHSAELFEGQDQFARAVCSRKCSPAKG